MREVIWATETFLNFRNDFLSVFKLQELNNLHKIKPIVM